MKRLNPFAMLAMAATLSSAAWAASGDDVTAFLNHPQHCQTMLGHDGQTNDGASADYAKALDSALGAIGQPTPKAMEELRQRCIRRDAAPQRTADSKNGSK